MMSRPDRWVFGTSAALILAGAFLVGATLRLAGEEPAKTREEQLLEAIRDLQVELRDVTAAWHVCEAQGPTAARLNSAAQATDQAIAKSLAARGVTRDKDGRAVVKQPEAEQK